MKTRIQFDFTDEQLARLDGLVQRMGAASRAEVVRRALHLMDVAQSGELETVGVDKIIRKTVLF